MKKNDFSDFVEQQETEQHNFITWMSAKFDVIEGALLDKCLPAADEAMANWYMLERSWQLHNIDKKTGSAYNMSVLNCSGCGYSLMVAEHELVPPCPVCHKTVFVKE